MYSIIVFSLCYIASCIGKSNAYSKSKSFNGDDSCPNNKFQCQKAINVLAFDGGGSRGIMEAMIADDLMRMFTLMYKDPLKLQSLVMELTELDKRVELRNELKSVVPIHPKDVFDMIAGMKYETMQFNFKIKMIIVFFNQGLVLEVLYHLDFWLVINGNL